MKVFLHITPSALAFFKKILLAGKFSKSPSAKTIVPSVDEVFSIKWSSVIEERILSPDEII